MACTGKWIGHSFSVLVPVGNTAVRLAARGGGWPRNVRAGGHHRAARGSTRRMVAWGTPTTPGRVCAGISD